MMMKGLDTVRLLEEYKGVPAGSEGTIVCEYDGTCFEVEFYDNNGDTIDVVTTPSEILEKPINERHQGDKIREIQDPINEDLPD